MSKARLVYYYGIKEMADALKEENKMFFATKGGTHYAVAVNKKGEPTNFIRIGKDPRPVKLRKRLRREARFLKQQSEKQS